MLEQVILLKMICEKKQREQKRNKELLMETRLFFILILLGISFFSQAQSNEESTFKLIIIPTSGGAIGYELFIKEKKLYVLSKKPRIEDKQIFLGEMIEKESINLSKRKLENINQYIQALKNLKSIDNESTLVYGAWLFDFFINDENIIKTNSVLIQHSLQLKKANQLLKYLMTIRLFRRRIGKK